MKNIRQRESQWHRNIVNNTRKIFQGDVYSFTNSLGYGKKVTINNRLCVCDLVIKEKDTGEIRYIIQAEDLKQYTKKYGEREVGVKPIELGGIIATAHLAIRAREQKQKPTLFVIVPNEIDSHKFNRVKRICDGLSALNLSIVLKLLKEEEYREWLGSKPL